MPSLLDLIRKHKPDETIEDVLEVLIWEIGDIAKCIHHRRNFPKHLGAYRMELKKALSDAITQIRLIAEFEEFSMYDLFQMGYDNFVVMLKERFPRKDST